MKRINKFFTFALLIAVLTLAWASPALAFDGIEGQNVVIEADEVINDDLYVSAENFTLDGIVKGDLFVVGQNITINGTVEGDLFAAGQGIVINGTVTGDARVAGAALQLGKTGLVNEDLFIAGASLEAREGSKVGGELLFGTGQSLLAGEVSGDVMGGTGALELRGAFGGDVSVDVGDANQGGPSPNTYMPNTAVSIPSIKPGFTINEDATIKGNLTYRQSKDINIPAGVVIGKVIRNEPVVDHEEYTYVPPTPGELAFKWLFNLLRTIVTLILLGLFLNWLAPNFVKGLIEKTEGKFVNNLGWGVVSYAAFFFSIILIFVLMLIGGMFFGVLTLGGISGSIVWLGILALFTLVTGFVLATSFLTKIIVAWAGGKFILNRFNPTLAEHKIWPLVIGVVILALLISIPLIGWMIGLLVVLLGLGALWVWGRERWQSRSAQVL